MQIRGIGATVLLVLATGLAVLGATTYYSLTAEYGFAVAVGVAVLALGLVALLAWLAFLLSPYAWTRWPAVAIPVLLLFGTLAATPFALGQKSEQYDAGPQCATQGIRNMAPEAQRAIQQAQQAFDSIEHVGRFGGGSSVGTDGCDRQLEAGRDVNVVQHYRAALLRAGWQVVEDDGSRLRAERDGMAFEVITCPGGGAVWAGSDTVVWAGRDPALAGGPRCNSGH